MLHASVAARRLLARVARDQRRARARFDAQRGSAVTRLRARRAHFSFPRPSLATLIGDRRVAPVLVLAIVLVALLATALPSANAAVGNTDESGFPYQPAIAGLRAAGALPQDDASGAGAANADAPPVLGVGRAEGDARDDLQPAGDYAVDGTLLKPLSAETLATTLEMDVYTVQAGDTLSGVASRFGLRMMTLWWANKLSAKDQLHVGQHLLIPPADGVVYTVKEGDTLDGLAARYHADVDSIVTFNQLESDELTAGQQLMIPDGVGAAIAIAQAPRTTTRTTARSTARASGPCTSCHFSGRMTWPVPGGYISQYFHYGHWAIDIANDYGSPIVAAASGRVIRAGWVSGGGGLAVWISDGNNLYTTYNHMSSIAVHVGQYVGRGQFIGRVGMSGNATGPHCHFEVWIGPIWAGGYRVNPLNYL